MVLKNYRISHLLPCLADWEKIRPIGVHPFLPLDTRTDAKSCYSFCRRLGISLPLIFYEKDSKIMDEGSD